MTSREDRLIRLLGDALTTAKIIVTDTGGTPPFKVTPGAALNSFVEEDLRPALAAYNQWLAEHAKEDS